MKSINKTLIVVLAVVAVVVASVLGTLAYLTDRSSVENTFTVGNVDIKLDEAVTDEDGNPVDDDNDGKPDRTPDGNEYHLVPGESYTKDPTITVKANSEESYVRMILTVYNASAVQAIIDADNASGNAVKDYADLFAGWDNTKWIYNGFTADTAANTISFEFRYATTVAGTATDVALEPLFTSIQVPGYATNAQMEQLYAEDGAFKIVVEGHAIQAATFANANEAWAAFDTQYGE